MAANKEAIGVAVEGFKAILRKFDAILALLRPDLVALLRTTAYKGEFRARSVAPRGATGQLQAGIKATKDTEIAWQLAVHGAAARYAPFVEYGTHRVSARGYMRAGKELIRAELRKGSRTLAKDLPGKVARVR